MRIVPVCAGSVVGVLAAILLCLIVAIIFILMWKKRATSEFDSKQSSA